MATSLPSGQSRIICWLAPDFSLTASGSPFNSSGHTLSALSETNGASTSWKHGRGLNSMPATLKRFASYRVTAGTAAITLPGYVAGNGGTIDLTQAVVGLPVANFTFTVNGGSVTFTPTGSAAASGRTILGYDWDFGDGSAIDFGNSPTHVYTSVGTFTARLRIMDDLQVRGQWVSKSVTVTVAGGSPSPQPSTPSGTPSTPVPSGTFPSGAPSGYVQRSALSATAPVKEFWLGNSVSDTRLDSLNDAGVDAIAATVGGIFSYGRFMIPGASLKWLWEHSTEGFTTSPYGSYATALANYKWDIVTFQPFDLSATDDLDYIQRYLGIVSSSSQYTGSSQFPRPWIYQRWPRKRDESQGVNDAAYWNSQWLRTYNSNEYFYECRNFFETLLGLVRTNVTQFRKALLIPVADVMYMFNQRAAAGQIPNYQNSWGLYADGIHLTTTGSYLVALTFYSAFYYRSPVGMSVPAGYGTIAPSLVTLIQNLVWEVVSTHRDTAFVPSGET